MNVSMFHAHQVWKGRLRCGAKLEIGHAGCNVQTGLRLELSGCKVKLL